jgi:ABC-type branched-subunit amino acid transport system ATPase component
VFRVRDVHAGYGATPILFGVSLEVQKGEAVALLGRNGMGKTTLMKTIIGFLKPWRGAIEFEDRDLTRLAPHDIARLGVGLVPENRRIFAGLTVRENLDLGLSAVPRRSTELRERRLAEVFQHFPRLRERLDQPGKTLSGGEQQMLLLGRALVLEPEVIMLDEPSLGLAPRVARQIFESMQRLKAAGMTVILVEQNARMGLEFADWGCVLDLGKAVFEGASATILGDPRIQELYLGKRRLAGESARA